MNQGRREEALKVFDKAVQLKPDDADLWRNLGNVLVDVERPADAILSFQHALKLNPRHWDAANKAGLLLYRSERFEEALACFNLCDELQPNHFPTLYLRALALHKLKRFEEALADNRRAQAHRSGERGHLQQYRQRPPLARPERRGVVLVRPESGTSAEFRRNPHQQGGHAR